MSRPNWIDKFLPKMQCDRGCGDCCGVAPCSRSEYDRAMAYAKKHGIEPKKQGTTCPFYQDGQCAIHPARPAVCRLFGHVPGMTCTRGYNVNIRSDAAKRILNRFAQPPRVYLLHRCVYEADEFVTMVKYNLSKAVPVTVNGQMIGRKPETKDYHAARALQMLGFPVANAFLDQSEVCA